MKELINHYHKIKKNVKTIKISVTNIKKNNKEDLSYVLTMKKVLEQLEKLFIENKIDYTNTELKPNTLL